MNLAALSAVLLQYGQQCFHQRLVIVETDTTHPFAFTFIVSLHVVYDGAGCLVCFAVCLGTSILLLCCHYSYP